MLGGRPHPPRAMRAKNDGENRVASEMSFENYDESCGLGFLKSLEISCKCRNAEILLFRGHWYCSIWLQHFEILL